MQTEFSIQQTYSQKDIIFKAFLIPFAAFSACCIGQQPLKIVELLPSISI